MKIQIFLSLLVCMSDTRGSEWDVTYDNDGELSAEPGMTAVLGCTFIHPPEFHPTAVAWLECGSKPRCVDGDTIFNSGDINATEGHLRGRMSLVEPDLSKKKCSVMIRDLGVSDSGSYQARVLGQMYGKPLRLDAVIRKPIKVTGLRQPRISGKTTVAEGGTLNLTCDAQSSPPSTVKWTEDGSDSPLVIGTQTATLVILKVTTKHSGRYSCTAHHLTKTLTASADVTVMHVPDVPDVPMIPNHVIAIITIIVVIIVALVAIGAPMAHMIHRDPMHELRREVQLYLQTGGDDGPAELDRDASGEDTPIYDNL